VIRDQAQKLLDQDGSNDWLNWKLLQVQGVLIIDDCAEGRMLMEFAFGLDVSDFAYLFEGWDRMLLQDGVIFNDGLTLWCYMYLAMVMQERRLVNEVQWNLNSSQKAIGTVDQCSQDCLWWMVLKLQEDIRKYQKETLGIFDKFDD